MDAQQRERRIVEKMTEIANRLIQDGPLSLEKIIESCEKDEMGLCQIAYSRLEADGLMIRDSDGQWRWNGPLVGKSEPDQLEPLKIRLYKDTHVERLDFEKLANYLKSKSFSDEVQVKENFLKKFGKEETPKALVESQVWNPTSSDIDHEIMNENVRLEKNLIEGNSEMSGVLYDGKRLMKTFNELIPSDVKNKDYLHIIYTNRFFGTWKPATQRYHSRISVYGYPCVISTTGIVDAPARPRGLHHLEKRENSIEIEKSKDEIFTSGYVQYEDSRLTEIMKGYAIQSVFYHLTSWPFCEDNKCRLYNPHAQANILNAQLKEPEFCKRHKID